MTPNDRIFKKKTSFERIIFDPKPSVFGRGRLEE